MLIQSLDLLSLRVPLHTPFKTALREVSHIHDVVVKLSTACGLVAYGSAPSTPQITGDDHSSIVAAINNVLKPLLIGQSVNDLINMIEKVHKAKGAGSNAKAAVDIALFDLYAQHKKLPLSALLQSLRPQSPMAALSHLVTDYTISVNDTQQMCADIDKAVSRGYRCLKIKIGNQVQEDFERLINIYKHAQLFKKQNIALSLRLDVNQGWDAATTVSIISKLEQQGIFFELVEQPVKAKDIDGLIYIKQHISTPLMADESAFSLAQVEHLYRMHAVDIINIKLIKAGGLYPAMQIAEFCAKHGIVCMIGCMLEGSIGVAAAAHLAAAYPDVISLIDLDGPTLGQYDPVINASIFDNANICLNSSNGLGISRDLALPLWSAT